MQGFDDVRFPEDISYGSRGGPQYLTDVVSLSGGHEKRNSNWTLPRARYNVAHGVKTGEQMDALLAFFHARRGRARGFRFKDWTDYRLVDGQIGVGDAAVQQFQIVKTYESGASILQRSITHPVVGSVQIYIDAAPQQRGVSVDHFTGIVTFDSAPESGAIISVTCDFDVPVRFDTDSFNASIDAYGAHSWVDIPIVEIRG